MPFVIFSQLFLYIVLLCGYNQTRFILEFVNHRATCTAELLVCEYLLRTKANLSSYSSLLDDKKNMKLILHLLEKCQTFNFPFIKLKADDFRAV